MPSLSPDPDEDDGIAEASSTDEDDGILMLSLSGMEERKEETGALTEPEDELELEEPEPEEPELPEDEEPPKPSGVVGLICCSLVNTLIFFTMMMFCRS